MTGEIKMGREEVGRESLSRRKRPELPTGQDLGAGRIESVSRD